VAGELVEAGEHGLAGLWKREQGVEREDIGLEWAEKSCFVRRRWVGLPTGLQSTSNYIQLLSPSFLFLSGQTTAVFALLVIMSTMVSHPPVALSCRLC
jgi:hypothetical protein